MAVQKWSWICLETFVDNFYWTILVFFLNSTKNPLFFSKSKTTCWAGLSAEVVQVLEFGGLPGQRWVVPCLIDGNVGWWISRGVFATPVKGDGKQTLQPWIHWNHVNKNVLKVSSKAQTLRWLVRAAEQARGASNPRSSNRKILVFCFGITRSYNFFKVEVQSELWLFVWQTWIRAVNRYVACHFKWQLVAHFEAGQIFAVKSVNYEFPTKKPQSQEFPDIRLPGLGSCTKEVPEDGKEKEASELKEERKRLMAKWQRFSIAFCSYKMSKRRPEFDEFDSFTYEFSLDKQDTNRLRGLVFLLSLVFYGDFLEAGDLRLVRSACSPKILVPLVRAQGKIKLHHGVCINEMYPHL